MFSVKITFSKHANDGATIINGFLLSGITYSIIHP